MHFIFGGEMRFEKGKGVFLLGLRPPSIRTVRTAGIQCCLILKEMIV